MSAIVTRWELWGVSSKRFQHALLASAVLLLRVHVWGSRNGQALLEVESSRWRTETLSFSSCEELRLQGFSELACIRYTLDPKFYRVRALPLCQWRPRLSADSLDLEKDCHVAVGAREQLVREWRADFQPSVARCQGHLLEGCLARDKQADAEPVLFSPSAVFQREYSQGLVWGRFGTEDALDEAL